jgi:hypothetical protein
VEKHPRRQARRRAAPPPIAYLELLR